ncbi:MAG: tyrosine-type recombinase/integrase [Verrucomicrobiae bacterium]|nr:tyrosine-type recombinase/integrase [Verrucomicrobiae bacterium]
MKKSSRKAIKAFKYAAVYRVQHPRYDYRVTYLAEGKPQQRYFKNQRDAIEHAKEKSDELAKHGTTSVEISADDRAAVAAHRQFLDECGWTIRKALEFAEDHLVRSINSPTVAEGVKEFLGEKLNQGIADRTLSDLSSRLNAFTDEFGECSIAAVGTDQLTDYIRKKGKPQTQRNHRRIIAGFFIYAQSRQWTDCNPADPKGMKLAKVKARTIGILTPGQACAMLTHAIAEIVPLIALALFAGIRREEIERLDWEDVRMPTAKKPGVIRIPANVSKTGFARKIAMASNLAQWLAPHRKESGLIHPGARGIGEWQIRNWFSEAREAAGITEWPANAFRHSFGTYRMEQIHDIGLVSEEMGNSPAMVKKHYQDAFVEPEDAHTFWSIAPTTEAKVVSIAAG